MKLPPDPQHAVLKKIYPWDEYNKTLVLQWLYAQAQDTGFVGTYEDFKLRYGNYVQAEDPQELHELIENYQGTYHIVPMADIEQTLKTKNKVLNQDIVIEAIPENLLPVSYELYNGQYEVTPLANTQQILRTTNKILEENIIIDQIPIHQVDNESGGRTVTIG